MQPGQFTPYYRHAPSYPDQSAWQGAQKSAEYDSKYDEAKASEVMEKGIDFHNTCDIDISEIADSLIHWEVLAPHLHLNEVDVSDIHQDTTNARLKRRKCLTKWKNRLGFHGTYRALGKILDEGKEYQAAEKLFDLVIEKTPKTSASPAKHTTIGQGIQQRTHQQISTQHQNERLPQDLQQQERALQAELRNVQQQLQQLQQHERALQAKLRDVRQQLTRERADTDVAAQHWWETYQCTLL